MNEKVNEFLSSNDGNQAIQSITKQHNVPAPTAQNAIRACAAGVDDVMTKGNMTLDTLTKGFGGLGGGLPPNIVKQVTDYVCDKTALSPAIAGGIVSMVLPKLIDFAKGAPTTP